MRTAKDEQIRIVLLCLCIVQRGKTIKPIARANVTGQLTDKVIAVADRSTIINADDVIAKFNISMKLGLVCVNQSAVRASMGEKDKVFVARRCHSLKNLKNDKIKLTNLWKAKEWPVESEHFSVPCSNSICSSIGDD